MEERLINCMVVEDSPAKYGELIDLITADNRLTHTSKNWAKTGTEALQILRNAQANGQRIDIIFLDIHLANSENAIDHFLRPAAQENVGLPHIVLITAYRKEYGEQILEIFGERAGQDIIFRMDKENGLITPSRFNNSIDNFIQTYNFQPIVRQNYINPNDIFLQLNNRYNYEEQRWAYENGQQNNNVFGIAYSNIICIEAMAFNEYVDANDKTKRRQHLEYVHKQNNQIVSALTNYNQNSITGLMNNEFNQYPCFAQITMNMIVNFAQVTSVINEHNQIIGFANIPNINAFSDPNIINNNNVYPVREITIGAAYLNRVRERYAIWQQLLV
jgi:CheY-like chemotaxis protein